MRAHLALSIAISFLSLGCGDDDGPAGADGGPGPMDASGGDGGEEIDCTGMPNGTACGPMGSAGFICIASACAPSSCGDGFVNTAGGEQCEDGNAVSRDGCEPDSCRYTCNGASDCDDLSPCNGVETCAMATHLCVAGTPPAAGTTCDLGMGATGVCRAGACVASGCGNMVRDGAEECDDGNMDDTDGCRTNCTFTCETDDDCQDVDACNGREVCNVAMHTCGAGTVLACNDMQACSTDTCDPTTGCVFALVDADADGFAEGTCTLDGMMVGGDCDDHNNTRYPGAPETSCDTVDSDCDGMTTDGSATQTCYRDSDGDGYGLMSVTMMACDCPTGYVLSRPGGFDCFDGSSTSSIGASVHPLQSGWFSASFCATSPICLPSWDYNCDGVATKRYPSLVDCRRDRTTGLCVGSGWVGTTVAACGATAAWRNCVVALGICGPALGTVDRTQECH